MLAALRRDASATLAQRAAAARVNDWAAVADVALAHDVGWWVVRALPPEGVPADAKARLVEAVRAVSVFALRGASQLVELAATLERADVRAVAFKGPALAADLHGDAGARWFSDLDLLIAAADRDRAVLALRGAGYASPAGLTAREARVYSRWEGAQHLERGDDWPVELHWRCQAPRYGGPQDPADIVARADRCGLGGATVLVPSPEDLGALLALHGVKHAWNSLLWVADFVAAASRPGFDWRLFEGRANGWRVRRAMHYALLVARDLATLDVPAALLTEAKRDARAARLARAVVARLSMMPGGEDVGTESTPRYDLQWLEGARARLRYLVLAAVLPTPRERALVRLPDALLPLAYPIRAARVVGRALGGQP